MSLVLWLALASAQEPIQRDRPREVMPTRHWDVRHLDLALTLHPLEGRLEGVSTHTVTPLDQRHGTLRLHQSALDIEDVTVDGASVEWRLGRSWLDIPMPGEGDTHEVVVRYQATPQTGLHFRSPQGSADPILEVWSQGENEDNRAWFPSWDYPNDKFTLDMHLNVPSDLVAVGNGVHTGTDEVGDRSIWHYSLERPIVNYLVALTVGDYVIATEEGPVPLEYIGARGTPDAVLRRGLDKARPQMVFFDQLLGTPYPYRVYRQVAVSRFMYGGMENSTLTILTDTSLVHQEDGRSRRTEELVAHELAHQWFGDLLTCYGWRELWLNEGFATFYTGRWLEHAYGPDTYAAKVDGWMNAAKYLESPMSPRGWSAMDGRDNEGVYVRGASVLHMLRVMLGDAAFDAAIRDYTADNADRLVETADLRRALEDRSGQHLGWFFDQYVHGVGIPSIASRWHWEDGQLTITLTQTTEGTPFEMPVQVSWADQTRTVWLGDGEARIVTEFTEAPPFVAVDPLNGVLAHWTRTQEPQAWARQAVGGPTVQSRLNAARALASGDDASAAEGALATVLLNAEENRRVRQVAAESLGALKTEGAGMTLLRALETDDAYLRESVVGALGALEGADRWASPLLTVARTDPDPSVRTAALDALGNHDAQRAGAEARRWLASADRNPHQPLHAGALAAMERHAFRTDLGLLIERTRARHGRSVRRNAALALTSMYGRQDDGWRDNHRRKTDAALIPWLDDPDIRIRQQAISTLGAIGGNRAESALERFAATNEVVSPDLSRAALDAAALIRMGQDESEEPVPDAELERIQQRLKDLEERLSRMEEGH